MLINSTDSHLRFPEGLFLQDLLDCVSVYIALDFDGVLHSTDAAPYKNWVQDLQSGSLSRAGFLDLAHQDFLKSVSEGDSNGELFDRSHHLIAVLKRRPDVRIVIATSWRMTLDIEKIKDLMPPDLASRVVGMLDTDPESAANGPFFPGVRRRLMERWIVQNANPQATWLAVDDCAALWEGHGDRLVNPRGEGMRPVDAIELLRRLPALTRVRNVAPQQTSTVVI